MCTFSTCKCHHHLHKQNTHFLFMCKFHTPLQLTTHFTSKPCALLKLKQRKSDNASCIRPGIAGHRMKKNVSQKSCYSSIWTVNFKPQTALVYFFMTI